MPSINSRGAGANFAGLGHAGHDVVESGSSGIVPQANAANEFDPYTRQWTQLPDGSLKPASGVIQRAAALMLPIGSIASTPTDGIDLEGIRRSNPGNRLAAVRTALERAWAPILSTSELQFVSIDIDPGEPWSGLWYANVIDTTTGQSARLSP